MLLQHRKWICKICEKAFRTSKALHEHEVVHTGARDFPCTICGKAFGTAANMRIHLMTHSDQRPFACLTCDATFRQKDSLKVPCNYIVSTNHVAVLFNFSFCLVLHYNLSILSGSCAQAYWRAAICVQCV